MVRARLGPLLGSEVLLATYVRDDATLIESLQSVRRVMARCGDWEG